MLEGKNFLFSTRIRLCARFPCYFYARLDFLVLRSEEEKNYIGKSFHFSARAYSIRRRKITVTTINFPRPTIRICEIRVKL